MGYKELYAKAVKDNKVKQCTYQIRTWEGEGEYMIGKVVEVCKFTHGEFDTEVLEYHIETDEGLFSTVLGAATDTQLSKLDIVGKVVNIIYGGQKPIKNGKRVNIFNVEVLT